ncbi:FAD-dependent monooxygenase [Pseudaestuariivita sp.]|uniref:FAD-dependent monooxygenase n=1 Tax=Pseudaestuariivita sp. TaxID=2211669 RepID=UPI00405A2460
MEGFTHDVIIVGGGPVGMGLAIDLGQRGVSVAVIERHAQPQLIPKGQNMTQRTLEHIDAWACVAEMRAARIVPRGVANGGLVTFGTLLGEHSYEFLPREGVQAFYSQAPDRMPQYCTEGVLRARTADLASVDARYGWTLDGFTQNADGVQVTVHETDGKGSETLSARYLVGCDGSRSPVREGAGISQTLSDHDRKMVLLVFRSPELHGLLGARHAERSFYNALAPELEGYWRFLGRVDGDSEWFFHAPVPEGTTRDNTDFAALLHDSVGQPFDLDVSYVGFWDLRFALADTYRAGRVLIAGDACHSHPPYGGYGINTGFEDARNLGWKLAATLQGWGGERLLDSYDAERRPVFASTDRDFIRRFIEEDRAFLAAHSPDDPGFAEAWAARNAGASEVFAFAPHYSGSPIIGGAGAPSAKGDHRFEARAGHHMAPRELPNGRSTYDALTPGFTLFDFGGEVEELTAEAEALGVPLSVVTARLEGEVCDYEASALLVRPDGYVAWSGDLAGAGNMRRAVGV